jgi:YVTN family beta-propeller protein
MTRIDRGVFALVLVTSLFVIISGDAAPTLASSKPIAVTQSAGRHELLGFSLASPPGTGWKLLSLREAHAAGFDILFVKTLGPNESARAYAVGYRTETGKTSPAEILKVAFDRAIRRGSSSVKTSEDRVAGAKCIRWEATREPTASELSAEQASDRNSLVSRYQGYLCSHPDAPAYVVQIAYSETAPKRVFPQVPEEGGAFIQSYAPIPLGVHVTQFATGGQSRAVAPGYSSVWVTEQGSGVISRVNPNTGAQLGKTRVGKFPEGFEVGHGAIWVANWASNTVSRIDPRTHKVTATIPAGRGPSDVAVDRKSVWVTSEKDKTVSRIDPTTNAVADVVHVNGTPMAIAAGTDALWVENLWSNEIWRIDSNRRQVVATVQVGRGRHMIAPNHDAVWVSNEDDGSVMRIDPSTNKVVATVQVGHAPIGVTSAGGMLWVANFGDSTLVRIDPRINQVKGPAIPVGVNPLFLGKGEKMLWALSVWGHWQYSTISRVDF